jgi:hypothetical protein
MLREVRMYYGGPGWLFPMDDTDGMTAYLSSSMFLTNEPTDYPPVFLSEDSEHEALLQLNQRLGGLFPYDGILIRQPRPYIPG